MSNRGSNVYRGEVNDRRQYVTHSHILPSTSVRAPPNFTIMNYHVGQNDWISCAEEIADRAFLNSNINFVMEYFKGSGCIFMLISRHKYSPVKPSTFQLEKAVVHLRMQYLRLFVLHFLSSIKPVCYRNLNQFIAFRVQLVELRYLIEHNEPVTCYSIINRLVDQTRSITNALLDRQTSWEKLPDGGTVTAVETAVEFLARMHRVFADDVSKLVGVYLPTPAAPSFAGRSVP